MSRPLAHLLRAHVDRIVRFWLGVAFLFILVIGFSTGDFSGEKPLYPESWIYLILIPCGYAGFALIHYSMIARSALPALRPSLFTINPAFLLAVNMAIPPIAVIVVCSLTLTISPNAFLLSLLVLPLTMPRAPGYAQPCSPMALNCFYALLAMVHAVWDAMIIGPLEIESPADIAAGLLTPMVLIPCGAIMFLLIFRFIPWHRRTGRFLWPSHLPPLPKKKQGMTLIELLICVAVLAIMASGISGSVMATHRTLQRQEEWSAAIALADDEIALLRARPSLPEIGTHAAEPELAERPYADGLEVEIKPGPADTLREVRVTVRTGGDANEREVALAAILPARSGREAE